MSASYLYDALFFFVHYYHHYMILFNFVRCVCTLARNFHCYVHFFYTCYSTIYPSLELWPSSSSSVLFFCWCSIVNFVFRVHSSLASIPLSLSHLLSILIFHWFSFYFWLYSLNLCVCVCFVSCIRAHSLIIVRMWIPIVSLFNHSARAKEKRILDCNYNWIHRQTIFNVEW